MKRKLALSLIACFALSSLATFTGCSKGYNAQGFNENVLRVASWDEYIDEGGEIDENGNETRALYEEFEDWYEEKTGKKITVEYIPLQDNETMYNKIKMGDRYDLLCPSEYMMMKLASEGWLQKYDEEFFNPAVADNYYAQYVSPYIHEQFQTKMSDGSRWEEYIAGYMWGTTGFVFNDKIDHEVAKSWSAFYHPSCKKHITAKDNVRDSYFVGLGLYYENELLALRDTLKAKENTAEYPQALAEYKSVLAQKMNDKSKTTMSKVKKCLEKMRANLYGLETDEGKLDIISGRLDISYQWSGDAVYILDEAEENGYKYYYSIPESTSNLWFDGWVMMKNCNKTAAQAFVNFLSRPDNVIRNMEYVGYTSCIGGDEVFEYVVDSYAASEEDIATGNAVPYSLDYFFGNGHLLMTSPEQTTRQLFAQYPTAETTNRLVVMEYFNKEENTRANRMWNNIK